MAAIDQVGVVMRGRKHNEFCPVLASEQARTSLWNRLADMKKPPGGGFFERGVRLQAVA